MANQRNTLLNLVSYVAIAFIGAALSLAFIFKSYGTISATFETLGFFMSSVVVAFYAFFYALGQHGNLRIGLVVVWCVAITLIVIMKLLPLFHS